MKIKTPNLILISIFTYLCFPGSGISDEHQNATDPALSAIRLDTSDIRTFQKGDTITYRSKVAGSGVAMTGIITQSIGSTVTNPAGKTCLEHTISTTYTGIGGPAPLNVRLLYYQDKHNSIYECGFYDNDNQKQAYVFITDTENTADGLAMVFESPMKLGNSTSNLTTFTDGSWKDCTRTVKSIEEVVTAVGIYESYKISESCTTDADHSNTNTTIWFVPSVYTIKESGVGDIIAGDFVLESFVFN